MNLIINNTYTSRIWIFVFIFFATGCKKLVEIDPPITGLSRESVYAENVTASAAVSSIYARMSNNGLSDGPQNISICGGLLADELTNYYTFDEVLSQFYTNSLKSTPNKYYWTELFQLIYSANSAIEGLTSSTTLSPMLKQQLVGEAKFMRAFLHFYAYNLYGDIPLITSTDYLLNNKSRKSDSSEVYNQIVTDLLNAKDLLTSEYRNSAGEISEDRIRPNKATASALLARVYLYAKDWSRAELEASTLINNKNQFDLDSDLNNVFLKNSIEAIWQLEPIYPGYNTYIAQRFILNSIPGNPLNAFSLAPQLLRAFEPEDKRYIDWVGHYTEQVKDTFSFAFKYKNYKVNPESIPTEYLMMFRLGEQFLIRAEARAHLGNYLGAAEDIDIIRHRAGIKSYVGQLNQNDLTSAIIHERQIELFSEWGHRWFDLKRNGLLDRTMAEVTPLKGGSWNSSWALLPIPQSEIRVNPNLTQNPGYN